MSRGADEQPADTGIPALGLPNEELASRPTSFRDDLLNGQVAVVSGGGSGIGKAIAFLFARLGAEVVICGRNAEKLDAVAGAIRTNVGREVVPFAMSIRDTAAVDALFDFVHGRFGRVDILVNNAGGQFPQDAMDFSDNGWLSVIDTNLNGAFWMMRAAARRWRYGGSPGNIVNIVANVSRGIPQMAHTCAARAGTIYLSKTLATEWAHLGIRINCIAPGATATEGLRKYPPEGLAHFVQSNPMRRLGDAWDIAQAAVYFAAETSRFITGELLTLDGGQQQIGVAWPNGRPAHFENML